jgi:hypothetical protein
MVIPITIFLVVIIIFTIIIINFNQPEFIIKKKDCWNLSVEIGIDWKSEGNYGENYNITSFIIKDYGYYRFEEELCKAMLLGEGGNILFEKAEYYPDGVGFECIGRKLIKNLTLWERGEKIERLFYPSDFEAYMTNKGYIFDYDKVYIENNTIVTNNKYFYVIIQANTSNEMCEEKEVEKWFLIQDDDGWHPREDDINICKKGYKNILCKEDLTFKWLKDWQNCDYLTYCWVSDGECNKASNVNYSEYLSEEQIGRDKTYYLKNFECKGYIIEVGEK